MSSTIWALTDATSAVGTQRIPVATAEAAGSNAYITPEYLRDYIAANMTPITLTGGTVTSSTPILDATQTWNSGGTTFTGLKLNVTDTASASASLLMDLQVGGSSKFNVDKAGTAWPTRAVIGIGSVSAPSYTLGTSANQQTGMYSRFLAATIDLAIGGSFYHSWNTSSYWINSNSAELQFGTGVDVKLTRDAANTLALRNSTSAQTFRVYSTYTDGSNFERGALNAGSDYIELAAETAGTGDDNLDVRLTPAGTGNVRYGTHSAIAAETVTGYITIKDAGGTLRKLAVVS